MLELRVRNKVDLLQMENSEEDDNSMLRKAYQPINLSFFVSYDTNVIFWSYGTCLITSQEGIFKDIDEGMSIKKDPCAVVAQELEFILNLYVTSIFMGNHYSRLVYGGYLCLEISTEYILVLYQKCGGIMVTSLIYGELWVYNKHSLCNLLWNHSIVYLILLTYTTAKELMMTVWQH